MYTLLDVMSLPYALSAAAVENGDLMTSLVQCIGHPVGVEFSTPYVLWYILMNEVQNTHPYRPLQSLYLQTPSNL